MAKRKGSDTQQSFNLPEEAAPRELIAIGRRDAGLRAHEAMVSSAVGMDVSDVASVLAAQGATMTPLFGENEERLQQEAATLAPAAGDGEIPDLSVYYKVDAPDAQLEDLCNKLSRCKTLEAVYIKPPSYLAQQAAASRRAAATRQSTEAGRQAFELINTMTPSASEAPPVSPDFTLRQGYLESAPGGIDARYAWTVPGGRGGGVGVIDIEGAWRFSHEDLLQNQGGIVGGTPTTNLGWRNHGTAVAGEISGDVNNLGITGIAPDAHIRAVSIFGGLGSAGAIRQAANLSKPGDIILIELHRPGPRATGAGQQGFIAIEWWPDDYDAIRFAVTKGVVVVEAAGNGAENLDDPVYNTRPAGFPADWRNPFNRSQRDSGAVVVGAGAPPPGTHNRNHGPDRSRLDFSNYGSAVDAQGWGREVTTAGYGDLQGGSNENLWYTDTFSGTSSASPIVVGAVACVQGALKARGRIPLSPARARDLLRSTGSAQTDAPGRPRTQRIGNRPNLRQLISRALQVREWIGVQFTGMVAANQTRRWFTHSWPAHWHVVWTVVPVSTATAPQIKWDVQVQRADDRRITYWISVTNLTNTPVNIEARYAVLGW